MKFCPLPEGIFIMIALEVLECLHRQRERQQLENKMTKGKVRKEYLLQTAVDIGDYTMVRYLVEQGADINKYVKEETENYSSTALQTACASQSQEILKYLKKHGGDSKKKDSEGRSCKKIAKDNKAVWNLELIQ